MQYDIFISYSRQDSKIVNKFYELFKSWGYSVWLDKDGIESGDAFVSVIVKAIVDSKVVVFFSSRSSNASTWTTKEIALAVDEKKKIIPIKLDSTKYNDSIRFQLIDLDYIDYLVDKNIATDRIKRSIESELGQKESKDSKSLAKSQKPKLVLAIIAVIVLIAFFVGFFIIPKGQTVDRNTCSIDTVTQKICKHILQKGLETNCADFGQLIVMECETGKIRAMVELKGTKSCENGDVLNPYTYEESTSFDFQAESGMMGFASVLACLETERIDSTSVIDTSCGVRVIRGDTIKDHNWEYGGYGELTITKGIAFQSNIVRCVLVDSIFKGNTLEFYKKLSEMGYGRPDAIDGFKIKPVNFQYPDSPLSWLGYNSKISPLQLLTFYNSIANKGVMVMPSLKEYSSPTVIVDKTLSDKNVIMANDFLRKCVTEGLSKKVATDEFPTAGIGNSCVINEDNNKPYYSMQFYAYFPINNPKYSIIVTINKWGLPASSGGVCAPIIKDIAEIIYYNKQ